MLSEFLDFMKKYWWVSLLIVVAFVAALAWFAAQEGARPESPFDYRMG